MVERPYPWEDVDMDMVRGRDAEGRYYVRCCCDWLTSSNESSQVSDALKDHVARCPDAMMADIEQQRIIERILSAGSLEEIVDIYRDEDDRPGD